MKSRLKTLFFTITVSVLLLFTASVAAAGDDAPAAEIVFVVDTTGSMSEEINFLQENIVSYVDYLEHIEFPYKIALVDYRDFAYRGSSEDYPYQVIFDFTNDISKIKAGFEKLSLGYGGDNEETVYSALMTGLDNLSWTSDSNRTAILIGDAAPLDPEPETNFTLDQVCNHLNYKEIVVHTISTSGSEIEKFSSIASLTGGKSFVCSSTFQMGSSIVDAIYSIINNYHVHTYGSWATTKEATCTKTGTKQRSCSDCGKTQTKTIPAFGHSYSNSCDATCNVCGAKRSVPHTYSSWKTTKAATCTKAGTKQRKCSVCGKTLTQTIPALGHSYSSSYTTDKAATCTANGSKSRHCKRCTAKTDVKTIKATGHKLKAKTTVKATTSKNGKIVKTCTACKKTNSTSAVAMIKTIKLTKTSYTYDGKAKTPSASVKDSKGKMLKKGTDYTVTYSSGRKNPGTYKAKITFKGNYSGTKTLSFKISVGKVTGLKQIKQSGYKLAFCWNAVPGATKYEVQIYESKNKKWVKIADQKGVKIGSKSLTGTNKFRVRAKVTLSGKTYYGAYSDTLTTKS